jgi:sugar lactone lactonase YvrE
LWWNQASNCSNGAIPDGVIGQPDFSAKGAATSRSGLKGPWGVAVDKAGNVWVSDTGNNRILNYATPVTNGIDAILVLGQSDFVSGTSTASQSGLDEPHGITIDDSGNVFVVDKDNCRVLKYSTPSTNGQNASIVVGQTDFKNKWMFGGDFTFFAIPVGITIDQSGALWVTDCYTAHTLKFTEPYSIGQLSSLTLGSYSPSPGASNSLTPQGVATDSEDHLYVADSGYNRILMYDSPTADKALATGVIGQTGFSQVSSTTSASGFRNPYGITFDSADNLWVADTCNNRVLMFRLSSAYTSQFVNKSSDVEAVITTLYGKVNISIPSGTFSDDVLLRISALPPSYSHDTRFKATNVGIEILSNKQLQPLKPINITLPYRSSDVIGFEENLLQIARYDDTTETWLPLTSTVYTADHRVVAQTNHLSRFGLVQRVANQDVLNVMAYPNPVRSGSMNFSPVPEQSTIRIYTIAGELVKTLRDNDDDGTIIWDGTNNSGSSVASGVYLAHISSSVGSKTLKVAVIK